MRNFEERKVEVFRRSENRIKEGRRKRNRILAFSIPLCMIVTMWAGGMISQILPVKKDDAMQENTMDILSGIGENFDSVVITETDERGSQTETITDSDKVTAIHSAILDLYDDESAETSVEICDVQTEEIKDDEFTRDGVGEKVEYNICFITADGYEVHYLLKNDELCNENKGEQIQLSKEQEKELLELLKLAD